MTSRFPRRVQRQTLPGSHRWQDRSAGGWRIGVGPSGFLLVEGSGWSRPFGRWLMTELQQRPAPKRKGRYRK